MIRLRFHANEEDYRPVKFPPPGPFWCTGYGDGYSIIVAFLNHEDEVFEYWPEASDIDNQGECEIKFSGRFPKPDWWPSTQES